RTYHLTEAAAAYEAKAWPRVIRHLDWLLADDPSNKPLCALRACAYAQIGQWSRVEEDHRRIDSHPARLVVLAAHRPVHVVRPGNRPLEIGPEKYPRAVYCLADTQILALLPGPGKRFTAVAGVAASDENRAAGAFTHTVLVGGREVFRSSGLQRMQPG